MVGIILVSGWILVGAVNLCNENEISKFSYFLVWSVAVMGLISHFFM